MKSKYGKDLFQILFHFILFKFSISSHSSTTTLSYYIITHTHTPLRIIVLPITNEEERSKYKRRRSTRTQVVMVFVDAMVCHPHHNWNWIGIGIDRNRWMESEYCKDRFQIVFHFILFKFSISFLISTHPTHPTHTTYCFMLFCILLFPSYPPEQTRDPFAGYKEEEEEIVRRMVSWLQMRYSNLVTTTTTGWDHYLHRHNSHPGFGQWRGSRFSHYYHFGSNGRYLTFVRHCMCGH